MRMDQDIGIPMPDRRDDGAWLRSSEAGKFREIGELLLRVDEMEDTLRLLETEPPTRAEAGVSSRPETMRRLEEQIQAERARLGEMERCGAMQYDQIERAIRLSEAMG